MDLTTLFAGALLLIAALGVDTALNPRDMILEVSKAQSLGNVFVTDKMLSDVLQSEVDNIYVTPSIVTAPVVRLKGERGIGTSIIESVGLSRVAEAWQNQIGDYPDEIVLHVYSEDGVNKVLVTGYDARRGTDFDQEVDQVKDELIVSLVRRAADTAMTHIDPYLTALNHIRNHIGDKDFKYSQDVIRFAKSRLPRKGISADRSLLENLEGMIALFSNDQNRARERFQIAVDSNPTNHVAVINLALMDVAAKNSARAVSLLLDTVAKPEQKNAVVLSAAYLTLAVAYLDLHLPVEANAAMQQVVAYNPTNPAVAAVWAEVKRILADENGAQVLQAKAKSIDGRTGAYSEIAVLYYTVAWENGDLVLRDTFDTVAAAPDVSGKTAPTEPETAVKAIDQR
jgi:hypothetical protein